MKLTQLQKGICFLILSAFFFCLMNVFVRMAGDLPAIQKSFFRNLIAFFVAAGSMARSGTKFTCKKGSMKYFILRSAFGTAGVLCNFYAVSHLMLADAGILNKMSPFFAIVFSVIILRERVTVTQMAILLTAFGGCLLVIKPSFANADTFAACIAFLGGVTAGAAYTYVRKLSLRGESGPCIIAFFSAFSCVVALPFLIFDYHPMTPAQIGILLLAGLMAAAGQFTITAAYSCAPAKEVSIFDYTQILFNAFFGFLFFGQVPDSLSWVGYVVIVAMAYAMYRYNNRKPAPETA